MLESENSTTCVSHQLLQTLNLAIWFILHHANVILLLHHKRRRQIRNDLKIKKKKKNFTSFCQPTRNDGILSEMIKDGGDVLHDCLLVIFNLMLTNHFPKQFFVGLITAVYKSGDKGDMSNYRGITVGSVIAKLFAMILDH